MEKAAQHRKTYEEMIKRVIEELNSKNNKSDQVKYVAYEIEEKRQYDVMKKNVERDLGTEKYQKKLAKEEKKKKDDMEGKHKEILHKAIT